jgi:hypothetical protein
MSQVDERSMSAMPSVASVIEGRANDLTASEQAICDAILEDAAGMRDELWEHRRRPHTILVNALVTVLARRDANASLTQTKALEVVSQTLN